MIDTLRLWAHEALTSNETENTLARANAQELLDLLDQQEGRAE